MSDEEREITDELLLSELTVGEFKQLLQSLLTQVSSPEASSTIEPTIEKITVRRKSLDEFMDDLGDQ